jgi:hypothetical protein
MAAVEDIPYNIIKNTRNERARNIVLARSDP